VSSVPSASAKADSPSLAAGPEKPRRTSAGAAKTAEPAAVSAAGDGHARGEHTREALLDAAEAVLLQEGVRGITTRRVAREAGVNQALVHYHFGSVEQLLVSAMERRTQMILDMMRATYSSEGTFVDKWSEIARWLLNGELSDVWPKIFLELVAISHSQPQVQAVLIQHIAESFALFEDNSAETFGELEPDVADSLMLLLRAVYHGLMIELQVGVKPGRVEASLDLMVSLLRSRFEPATGSADEASAG
jgi:AcrR family transcriptional regulator